MFFLLSLLIQFSVHAQNEALPTYPSYEPETGAVLALFNQDKLAPSYIRTKFSELTNGKRREITDYGKKHREHLSAEQTTARENFNNLEREAIKLWRRENPKGDFREYQKGISVKRKAFTDLQTAARRELEDDLKSKMVAFSEFMKVRQEEFQKKITEYSNAQRAKPSPTVEANPALQEFKEIPKGPGIPLSPK